jgi:hypothetical protein
VKDILRRLLFGLIAASVLAVAAGVLVVQEAGGGRAAKISAPRLGEKSS